MVVLIDRGLFASTKVRDQKMERLADHEHPLVRGTAATVTKGETTLRGKLDRLFMYVRDGIKFGFPYDGDLVNNQAWLGAI